MEDYDVDVKCPLCEAKTRLNRIERHKNRKHPEISVDEYQALIEQEFLEGKKVFDTRRVPKTKAPSSTTTTRYQDSMRLKGGKQVVPGGLPSLGKRR
jgi:uncharacterized Zn finger protein (UPF0148 family)